MDTEESYKTNLNLVKEMILDEEKFVTYITLSKDLCIHVNNSKQLLCSAVRTIREEHPHIKLSISYIISGSSAKNAATTTVCSEGDLPKLQKSLNNVFFHHVYSVSKGSSGVDKAALLLLNKYEDYSLCSGMIRSKECIKRTSDEIGNLKTTSQEAVVLENKLNVVNKKLKQEPKHISEASMNGQVEDTKAMKHTETKSDTKIKVEATSPKKDSNNKQTIQKTNVLKHQKGIASFFNKSNGLPNSKTTIGLQNKNVTNGVQIPKLEDEKMDVDNKIAVDTKKEGIAEKLNKSKEEKKVTKKLSIPVNESKEEKKGIKKESIPINEFKEENKDTKQESLPDKQNKVLNKIKRSSRVDKKRKRVLHVSDSESDEDKDMFDNQENHIINTESDDEIPPTPLANSIKITSGIVNPKKKRKVVDKTYTAEDGYILTKKEEVYESCSENENEIVVENEIKIEKETRKLDCEVSPNKTKKNSPKKSKKKISPPQKGKQPTLNSFFNRK